MRFKTDGTCVTFKRRETLYLYVLYYPPVHNANKNESREIIIMKKFNAFAISQCIIAFDIVVGLYCSLEGGLSFNDIAFRSCNINLETDDGNTSLFGGRPLFKRGY